MEFIYQSISNTIINIFKVFLYIINIFGSNFRFFILIIEKGERYKHAVDGMNIYKSKLSLMNQNLENAKYIFCVHLF